MKNLLKILSLISIMAYGQQPEYVDLNGNGSMDAYENKKLSLDERADDLLQRMTTDDKVNLVVGIGFNIPGTFESIQPLRVPGAVGGTYSYENLGINGMITTDGPAGVRILPIEGTETYYCTAFPVASLISSTWDTNLAYQVGSAMGNEVKEYGMDILLGPALNIHRDPLAGRNFEYFSEDPLLSGKMTASVTNGIQSHGVGTSLKHFAANNQETNRMSVDAVISERALREIYLKGFEIAVKEAQPWTMMSSYNNINGTPASHSYDLLTKILREEWGFEGFVMTDWFGGNDAIAQMKAGNDLLMPGRPDQRKSIKNGIESGALDIEDLDRNAKRILKILLNSPSFNQYKYSNKPDLDGHAELARNVAAQGAVLLKNDNTLPVKPEGLTVATFGIGSYDFIAGGSGSGDVVEAYTISLVQGLENAGITIDPNLKSTYESYLEAEKANQPQQESIFFTPSPIKELEIDNSIIKAASKDTDLAFITIGRNSGEFADRKIEGDFNLDDTELGLIEQVTKVFHNQGKKVVMILNIGNVIETASWKNKVDAILLPWQGGQEAGNALVDVLTGKVTPSGKLPTSFPLTYEDVPSSNNFPGEATGDTIVVQGWMKTVPSQVFYEEGIYVGYRYYTSFDKEVSYPFGYGLSYSTFDYSDLVVSNENGVVSIDVTVSNTGKTEGKEVVQIYVSAPGNQIDQPELELRSFGKTRTLKPGESESLHFSLDPKDYASFDTSKSAWILEAGEYQIKVGASCTDIKLSNSFSLNEDIIVEKLSNALAPAVDINELK